MGGAQGGGGGGRKREVGGNKCESQWVGTTWGGEGRFRDLDRGGKRARDRERYLGESYELWGLEIGKSCVFPFFFPTTNVCFGSGFTWSFPRERLPFF